ncbi:alpha/beta fold hydrolase [Amycolatopsis sp. GM8]|uniref:alpha/beta fold hydrolase n=1 Tax=Amycolatopsis sp. GM8 TaxID=2896530 RepID=UPI001F2E8CA8|nr:alpha/beta fold hydrolase [Amycolatopsis sp. GM8]
MSVQVEHHQAVVNGLRIHYVTAGSGYPLVLTHGWPQSWYAWRKVIPALAEKYQIIAPDLRGLGDSEKPASGYAKRTIATDVSALVRHLGLTEVGAVGHDWGGAVAFYFAYDNPDLVRRLMVLDMVPNGFRAGEPVPLEYAVGLNHMFFLGGQPDVATMLISQNVDGYLRRFLSSLDLNYSPNVFDESEIAEYVRVHSLPGSIRAGCQWYAAGLREDAENIVNLDHKLAIPVSAWGASHCLGDVRSAWERVADHVEGGVIEQCGHFIAEEKPRVLLEKITQFFARLADASPNSHVPAEISAR